MPAATDVFSQGRAKIPMIVAGKMDHSCPLSTPGGLDTDTIPDTLPVANSKVLHVQKSGTEVAAESAGLGG